MALRTRKRTRKGGRGRDAGSGQRSSREWIARGALALGFAVMGYIGTASSLAHVVAKADPMRAHLMAPNNGVILAEYAQNSFTRSPAKDSNSTPADLARKALLADPTAAGALTVLGFQAQLRGDTAEADRIFSYSTAISRRELRPRLWAIEESIGRGDIAGALRNYDIALRTSNDAAGLLFPSLSAALAEARIRAALLPILDTDPVWKDSFLDYIAKTGIEPEGAIALFREGRGIGLEASVDAQVNLVNALVGQNKRNEAWAYYRTFQPGVRRDRSRDPNFALATSVKSVFDWQAGADTRLSAAILQQGNSGLLDFSVPPSVGGELVNQTQLLPPGSYRLEGRSRGIDQPERSRPYWSLTCQDGRQLGRVVLSNSDRNSGRFTGRFDVPAGCTSQILTLVARSTDDIMGVSGQVESALLRPL
ncbi:MAG: hypothetical protein MK010_01110 [Erythrobacter sp.]|nr:hypothetical protein [Erythrobacter sp.]